MKIGYDYWQDKKIACLGDSITAGAGNNGYGWVEFLKEIFPQADVRKHGVSGSTVAVCDRRKEAPFVERMKEISPDYDLCIVFGGINDFINSVPLGEKGSSDIETFYGALEYLLRYLLEQNPKGEIMLLTPMRVNGFKEYPRWQELNKDGKILKQYRQAILELAEQYAVPVLDLFSMGGINTDVQAVQDALLPDALHPSKEGHMLLARKVAQFMVSSL
jgi:lysophospholipase L1-like esterase